MDLFEFYELYGQEERYPNVKGKYNDFHRAGWDHFLLSVHLKTAGEEDAVFRCKLFSVLL